MAQVQERGRESGMGGEELIWDLRIFKPIFPSRAGTGAGREPSPPRSLVRRTIAALPAYSQYSSQGVVSDTVLSKSTRWGMDCFL